MEEAKRRDDSGGETGGEGWTEFRSKRHKKKNGKEMKDNRRWNETSFFVANIPDTANRFELKELFAKYGRVTDVYIAIKKDSSGCNFAFIRFNDVANVVYMEERLNDMKFKNNILMVNVAKFSRGNDGRDPHIQTHTDSRNHEQPVQAPQFQQKFRDSRSFRHAVDGRGEDKQDSRTVSKMLERKFSTMMSVRIAWNIPFYV